MLPLSSEEEDWTWSSRWGGLGIYSSEWRLVGGWGRGWVGVGEIGLLSLILLIKDPFYGSSVGFSICSESLFATQ